MKHLATIDCQQGAVRSVRYNVDGDYCLTSGSNKTVKLWNPNTQKCLKTYSGHGYEVMEARGSCDNSLIVSCSMDKTVVVWDVSTGVPQRKLRHHVGETKTKLKTATQKTFPPKKVSLRPEKFIYIYR